MAKTKYYIRLSADERALLIKVLCENREASRTIMRARILLMSDMTQANKMSIRELAERLGTTETTIKTVRAEYAASGLESALYRKPRVMGECAQYRRRINDRVASQIRALAAEAPPCGHKKWSSRLLSDEAVKRGIVSHIASSTVCKILKGDTPYGLPVETDDLV